MNIPTKHKPTILNYKWFTEALFSSRNGYFTNYKLKSTMKRKQYFDEDESEYAMYRDL
jgi:hypothetical protein